MLLHLTQREKKQIVRFPSLMFVRRIPYQSVRRRKIQQLAAVARAHDGARAVDCGVRATAHHAAGRRRRPGTGARELVVLLDTSYSMGYGDRWERARKAAQDAVSSLSASDRGSVVLFSSGTEIVVRSSGEREKLMAAVETAKAGAGATRFAPALKVAGSILADSRLPRREAMLISDFQRGGWRGEEGARLPQGATITPVPIQGPLDRPNVGITAISFARSTFSDQERVTVTAALANRGERPATGVMVKLEVDKLPVGGAKPISLEPGGTTSVTFDPFTVGARNMRGTVSIGEDALLADNVYHFVSAPAQPVRIALLDRGAESGRYLRDALSVGDSPKFETVARQPEALTDDDLTGAPLSW